MSSPAFSKKSELARYINVIHRRAGKRPSPAAFLDEPSETPDKDYLSVNSLEIESLQKIAEYYRMRWQNGKGSVAVSTHKVSFYNKIGQKCGIQIRYDGTLLIWLFRMRAGLDVEAYKHYPLRRSDQLRSESHAGVEFTRALRGHRQSQFARRMSEQRFHLV